MITAEKLEDVIVRLDRNVPHHSDPNRFHEEKSELVAELRRWLRWIRLQPVNSMTDLLFVKGEIEHGVTLDEVRSGE